MRQCSSLQMILFYNFENEVTVIIAKKNRLKCLKFSRKLGINFALKAKV